MQSRHGTPGAWHYSTDRAVMPYTWSKIQPDNPNIPSKEEEFLEIL
jgi:hypothetical protein